MFELIEAHQLNMMLVMSGICAVMALLMIFTKILSRRRKWILVAMEIAAMLILSFDRLAYIYSGDMSPRGYVMERLSNFIVFFLTPAIVMIFNFYLCDLLTDGKKTKTFPVRLNVVSIATAVGMLLAVVSQFTGLYYTIDENNRYSRSPGFIICYIIPVVCPLIQFSVISARRKRFSRLIFTSLLIYIFVPVAAAIIQVAAYGLSLVNMALALVSICLYIFTYLDVNETIARAHMNEMETLEKERGNMKRLFEQTAVAFAGAVEGRNEYGRGHSVRVANLARRIAKESGRSDEECDDVYYCALVHNVGMITLPDDLVGKEDELEGDEYEQIKSVPEKGAGILSEITDYPELAEGARYCCERYDGNGYPEGRQGKAIPYTARIISIADAYDDMAMKKSNRDPIPIALIREEFIKDSGSRFDPEMAKVLVGMIDREKMGSAVVESVNIESELTVGDYRSAITAGVPVSESTRRITFKCVPSADAEGGFSAPSIILFDSFDRHVHDNERSINAYHYIEYGELWFDGRIISTEARNMITDVMESDEAGDKENEYLVTASRFEDHVRVELTSASRTVTVTVALPDSSKAAYIALTGEHCIISEINVDKTGDVICRGEIQRIADKVSYIDRMESDIPNVQVDRTRSASSDGVEVSDGMRILFHTMSLPTASLVWHCPYIVLFYSEDGKVGGRDYREYALIKLNGENGGENAFSKNSFTMKKSDAFPGWDVWKETNRRGMECEVGFIKRKKSVTLVAENLGIYIENTSVIDDGLDTVYAALTGDQCAITDIRIEY